MIPDELREIEDRVNGATPGPWFWRLSEFGPKELVKEVYLGPSGIPGLPAMGHPHNILKCTDDWCPHTYDAEFIASARTDVVALVQALKEAWAELRRYHA